MMNFTDEQLVSKVFEDKEYFGEIVERYVEKLGRFAHYLVNSEEDAEDIVQSALVKAYVNLRSFDTRKKFSTWVYRIVHNEAISFLRRKKVYNFGDGGLDFPSSVEMEEELEKKELIEEVHKCLSMVPVKYKAVLTLYFLEEKTYEEISDILRIPMGTVATNISRGKKIMKSICNKKQK